MKNISRRLISLNLALLMLFSLLPGVAFASGTDPKTLELPAQEESTSFQQSGNVMEAASNPCWTGVGGTYANFALNNKTHTLTLDGMGGTINGSESSISLVGYNPITYDLGVYVFQKDGYIQANWLTTFSSLLPLNTQYTPTGDSLLMAQWESAAHGDVIINALAGKLSDGSNWAKTSGKDVTLPTTLTYDDGVKAPVAWGSQVVSAPDDLGLLRGIWYESGSTVTSNNKAVTALYARECGDGAYVVYHPSGGTVTQGGNILVQFASCEDGQSVTFTTLAGDHVLPALDQHRLVGWALSPGGDVVYEPLNTISATGDSVTHLYAVWSLPEDDDITDQEGCKIRVNPDDNTISVEVTQQWYENMKSPSTLIAAAYDSDGKMITCEYRTVQAHDMTSGYSITLSYRDQTLSRIALFALDSSSTPTGSHITLDLSTADSDLSR